MKLFSAICVLVVVVGYGPLLHAQVPYDLSKAREFKTVWSMQLGGRGNAMTFSKDFCEFNGLDVLTTGVSTRGRLTWRTRPKLDTVSLFNWLGINNAVRLQALDYDGIPPNEYVNYLGVIWKCSQGESPFPLMPIDTVFYQTCVGVPAFSTDVDGDGYLDVVTDIGGDGKVARIILGGPTAGKGCERVLPLPMHFGPGVNDAKVYAFYQSSIGGWVLIQWERCAFCNDPAMRVYDVTFERKDGKLTPIYTFRDEMIGPGANPTDDPFGGGVVVVDTILKRDFFMLERRLNTTGNPWVVERYDVTNRKIVSTGEQVSGYDIDNEPDYQLGHRLELGKAVFLFMSSGSGGVFCFSDNITTPFARWLPTGTGTQPVAGFTVINDQTGDGLPDIIVVGGSSSNATMILISLDSNVVSVKEDVQPPGVGPVTFESGTLTVTLNSPVMVSATISSVSGKRFEALPPRMGIRGANQFPLDQALSAVPPGVYFLVVRMGEEQVTISFLQQS
jgi:hypothetical protein